MSECGCEDYPACGCEPQTARQRMNDRMAEVNDEEAD